MNKFKLNEVVSITRNIDLTNDGGPYIPLGTRAVVLRRRKHGESVWVKIYGYGERELLVTDIRSGNTPSVKPKLPRRKTGEHLFSNPTGGIPRCVTCGCDEDDAFVGGEECSFTMSRIAQGMDV